MLFKELSKDLLRDLAHTTGLVFLQIEETELA
jgi:hypothetical protein